MTCTCRPCVEQAGACARVLVLSSKDESDARRLWRRFEISGTEPQSVNLKTSPTQASARLESAEPTEGVRCRCCNSIYRLPAFLAAFLREQRAPAPHCTSCQEAR